MYTTYISSERTVIQFNVCMFPANVGTGETEIRDTSFDNVICASNFLGHLMKAVWTAELL